jgi:hypothetical protein
MLDTRIGEGGVVWTAGESYSATDDFAKWLVQRGFATAYFELPANYGWEDLRFPAQGINPAGSVEPPAVNTTDGLLDFASNKDCIIAGVAQLSHGWLKASPIRPHIHVKFRNAAAGDTIWKFEYDIANVGDEWAETYESSTKTLASPENTKRHAILSFDEIAMTGYRESCCILWRISRLGASDAADTHDQLVALVEFDIHHVKAKYGTEFEIPT